jgi:hypothetical protein
VEWGYEEGMNQWGRFLAKDMLPAVKKARPKKYHPYSPETEAEVIEGVQRITKGMLADLKRSHPPDLWPKLAEQCKAIEEKRIAQVRLFFIHKRGGCPY